MSDQDEHNPATRSLVVVAGSARSGTSLCSGLLHRLGFHIPQPEVEANRSNPRGLGESQWAVDFHQRWLDTVDVSKDDARPIAAVKMARLANRPRIRAELGEWLSQQFAVSPRLVVKDSRLTWFIGLYAEIAAELDARLAVLTMVRHPVDTVRSRELAYGSGVTDTARISAWVNLMQTAEHASRLHPRALISHPDLLANWRAALSSAGPTLGFDPVSEATTQQLAAADELVDPAGRHADATWDDYAVPPELRTVAEATYTGLLSLTADAERPSDPSAVARLDELREQYAAYYASCEQVVRTSILAARRDQRRKDTEHAASLERELNAARKRLSDASLAAPSSQTPTATVAERVGRLGAVPRRAAGRVKRMVTERGSEPTDPDAAHGERRDAEQSTDADQRRKVYLLTVWLTGAGGVARAVSTLANTLARWCDVEVISVERGRDDPLFALDPRVKVSYLVDQREESARHGDDEMFAAPVVRMIKERLAAIPSGVVIANRPILSAMAAEACGDDVVVIAREHSAYVVRSEGEIGGLRNAGNRIDAVVALTETDRAAHAANMEGTSAQVVVIPNAIPWPLKGEKKREEKVIVAAGALVPNKGHARLFEAFAPVAHAHPDWQLHLYGQGRLKKELQEQAEQLGLQDQIFVKGYTDKFQRVLNRAAIFALSSYYEAFGLVLVEAMSKSVPVVTFDCPSGPRHVVQDGVNGILVPDGDIAGYTRALMELVEDEAKRHAMGRAGREAAIQYGPNRVADQWLVLIDETTQRRTGVPVTTRARRRPHQRR